MTRFGLGIGLAVIVGLSAWGFARGTESHPDSVAEPVATTDEDSTHDEAVHRHRTNQSNHWRHVMVGRR
ncbi:MAG: hypothetical protein U0804_27445 [Gemmataceae bacterium]